MSPPYILILLTSSDHDDRHALTFNYWWCYIQFQLNIVQAPRGTPNGFSFSIAVFEICQSFEKFMTGKVVLIAHPTAPSQGGRKSKEELN